MILPTHAKACLVAANVCGVAILAIPFAARWFFPVVPIRDPKSLGDLALVIAGSISAAGRGAFSWTAVCALSGFALLLAFAAYFGLRRADGASRARRKCAVPVLVTALALVAAVVVLDDVLPELRR